MLRIDESVLREFGIVIEHTAPTFEVLPERTETAGEIPWEETDAEAHGLRERFTFNSNV